jgi:hypothetical protein
MYERVEECLEVGVIQGGVGTPVHGVQDVGAGVEECLEVHGSDPGWSWHSCTRSPRYMSRWRSV